MKPNATAKPVIISILLAGLTMAACDSMVRFESRKFACDSNVLGLDGLEIHNRSGKLTGFVNRYGNSYEAAVEKDNGRVQISGAELEIGFVPETGEASIFRDKKFIRVNCPLSETFSM
ncbi:MAG: hypothetical protein ACPGGG_03060 [Parvibaculales bacterium]